MAMIKGGDIGLWLGGLLTALLTKLLGDEFKAWSPRLVRLLINRAVARLAECERPRFEEEWRSHIDETPGEIWKIISAAGFVVAAIRMRRLETEAQRRMFVYDNVRRFLDFGFSSLFLIFFAPVFLFISLAIRLTRKGPVFEREVLVGKHGNEFTALSFGGIGIVQRFLDRTGLTSLPRAINVFRGELSFVGPFPFPPHINRKLASVFPNWRERTKVTPGLFALVNIKKIEEGPDMGVLESFQAWLGDDLLYIRNRGLYLDAQVIWRGVTSKLPPRKSD